MLLLCGCLALTKVRRLVGECGLLFWTSDSVARIGVYTGIWAIVVLELRYLFAFKRRRSGSTGRVTFYALEEWFAAVQHGYG